MLYVVIQCNRDADSQVTCMILFYLSLHKCGQYHLLFSSVDIFLPLLKGHCVRYEVPMWTWYYLVSRKIAYHQLLYLSTTALTLDGITLRICIGVNPGGWGYRDHQILGWEVVWGVVEGGRGGYRGGS